MNIFLDKFILNYCELTVHKIIYGGKIINIPVLYLKTSGNVCIFYKNKECSIHDVKPYNCSAAPIISLLFQDKDVIRFFKDNCKGYGKGTYYSKGKIAEIINHESELEKQEFELCYRNSYDAIINTKKEMEYDT